MAFARAVLSVLLALATVPTPSFAQDEVTRVEGLLVTRGEAPLPIVGRGAPNYAADQTAMVLCASQRAAQRAIELPQLPLPSAKVFLKAQQEGILAFRDPATNRQMEREQALQAEAARMAALDDLSAAQRAHDATLAARAVRVRAARGEATTTEMERAERERQAAVRRIGAVEGAGDLPGSEWRGLVMEGVERERVLEHGRAVLIVRGRIRNTTGGTMDTPPVTIWALDVRGFRLAGQTSAVGGATIGPGQSQDFAVRFWSPPQYAAEVKAHFATPFGRTYVEGCSFTDPLTVDADLARVRAERQAVRPVPIPKVGAGAPLYQPDELAVLARLAKADAETAFVGRERAGCAPAPSWRPLLIAGDLMEAAQAVTIAAEEARRDAARGVFLAKEVEEAELSRQAAVRAFMLARPGPLRRSAAPRPGLALKAVSDPVGIADLLVTAFVGNANERAMESPPLLVTVIDRHGQVITEGQHRLDGRIDAGSGKAFSVTIPVPPTLVREVTVTFAC